MAPWRSSHVASSHFSNADLLAIHGLSSVSARRYSNGSGLNTGWALGRRWMVTLRRALRTDVREIMRVRHAVQENRLTSRVISDEEVVHAIEQSGRGWVVERENKVVGFAIGNAETGNIWALFVDPEHRAQGHGRRLHDEMIAWLWSRGLRRLWLSTEPGTRAQRFYERAGWQNCGSLPSGELRFELDAP